ncbi:SusD/RagB family nutrient-binding outer membrane lipoprotein [Winogradskyella tangerina]|uniref:SusD/RagB family nutrient-binding outer membrane lipoprotein n=1 Tax=Winogradskyella tangerina TaxID=2023240 RepID=UPI000DBE81F8|nr:SusD/RagB family nutrient-binding outer membrane lipoprotein [Winogradskyella tangerina]
MKNFNRRILSIFFITMLFACGDDFGDLNVDPTRPGGDNAQVVAIVPIMQTQTHRNLLSSAARIAGIFTQQFKGFDAQQVAYTQYAIGESTLANFWEFGLYTGSMRDCIDTIERAEVQGDIPATQALAQIYLAVNLGIATNLWGDIPYSEAFQGSDNVTPSYDSQEEIYNSIFELLDDAIVNLQLNDPQGTQGDLVNANWTAVAHALKARFHIQLSKRDPDAGSKALMEIQSAFTSNAQTPSFIFEGNANGGNPLALFGIQRPNTLIIGDYFDSVTDGDPRKVNLMVANPDNDQLYFENGNDDLFWAQFDSPSPLISFSELKFIEAEAQLLTGENSAVILNTIRDAVRANMEYLGVNESEIVTYTNAIITSDLETIINEKYKALYGSNFIQVWNDYRRTGYPNLTPDPNGVNGSNPSGVIPRRILYPDSERLANNEAYENAIAAQGGHLLDDDLWAFPSDD